MPTTFCTKCGSPGEGAFCADCGTARDPALVPMEHRQQVPAPQIVVAPSTAAVRHGVPALLSFFIPGLGQIIKGDLATALIVWLSLGVSAMLAFLAIGIPLGIVIWFIQIYDAYTAPDAETKRQLKRLRGK